jgi:hypothetical protein
MLAIITIVQNVSTGWKFSRDRRLGNVDEGAGGDRNGTTFNSKHGLSVRRLRHRPYNKAA